MTFENKRLEFLDALKGFAILLVVAGHWMIRLGISGYDNVVWTFIVSLHLPLFFFVSGYLSEGKCIGFSTLAKKAKNLLLPGIIFFTLYSISSGTSPLSFIKYGFGEYWFTFVLFEIFLIYFICGNCFKRYGYVVMFFLSLFGVVFLAIPQLRSGQFYIVFCLENLFKFLQFFTLGLLCKKYKNVFFESLKKDKIKGGLFSIFIVSFFLCFYTYLESQHSFIYKMNHDIIFRYLGVLVILAIFINKSDFFKSHNVVSRSFTFIGQRTLDIYLIHYFLLPTSFYIPDGIKCNTMWYVQLLVLLLLTLAVIGGCILMSNLIRLSPSLASLLLGVRKNK